MTVWAVEAIPDSDQLYMRVHRGWHKPDGTVSAGAFRNHEGGMSTDWAKYATPQETRARAKSPLNNAVVALSVAGIRDMAGQTAEHSPFPENRAHTNVMGDKDEETRVRLRRLATIVLPLPRVAM